ncbi:hypothetical protein [Lysobacter capsici]|uniref:hypothetical protein n=1 Tax=Lysobacter capsici TaxID=435897 RepID=UPI00398D62F5
MRADHPQRPGGRTEAPDHVAVDHAFDRHVLIADLRAGQAQLFVDVARGLIEGFGLIVAARVQIHRQVLHIEAQALRIGGRRRGGDRPHPRLHHREHDQAGDRRDDGDQVCDPSQELQHASIPFDGLRFKSSVDRPVRA